MVARIRANKAVGKVLRRLCRRNSLVLLIGVFNQELVQLMTGMNGSIDDDDDEYKVVSEEIRNRTYTLSNFHVLEGSQEEIPLSLMQVNLEDEVIPDNCFHRIKPYKLKCTGYTRIDINLSYRNAAMVFWPEENTIQNMVYSMSLEDLDSVGKKFLEMYDKYSKTLREDEKIQVLKFANALVQKNYEYYRRSFGGDNNLLALLSAISSFNDLTLLQAYLNSFTRFANPHDALVLIPLCEKYGWETLSDQLKNMIQYISRSDAVAILSMFIEGNENELGMEKKLVLLTLARAVSLNSYYGWDYNSICDFLVFGRRIGFNCREFADSKSFQEFVPALLKLASKTENALENYWDPVVAYFLNEMEGASKDPKSKSDDIKQARELIPKLESVMSLETKSK